MSGIARPALVVLLGLALVFSTARPLSGQWYVSGAVGSTSEIDADAASSSTRSFQVGLQGFTDAGRLLVTGGLPVRGSEDVSWASVELAASPFIGPRSRRGLGLQPDLLGRGFAYEDPVADVNGMGGLLIVEPYLAHATDGLVVRIGGGGRASVTRVADGEGVGGLPVPGGSGARQETRSTGRTAAVVASDVRVRPARRVSIRARAEVLRLESATLPHLEAGVVFAHEHGAVWAGADHWTSNGRGEAGWYAGTSVDLTGALTARVGIGRSSGDPMFATSPRNTWSVGLRYRIAGGPDGSGPALLAEHDVGNIHLRVPARLAEGQLFVAGSFNDWDRVPMTRSGDDWTIHLDLDAGYYELAFVDEEGSWFVPEGMDGRRPDGMGGWVLRLAVR